MENSKNPDFSAWGDYGLVPCNTGTLLLLYVPYTPFESCEGIAFIDSYYIASNTAYNLARKAEKELLLQGYSCKEQPELDYKKYAQSDGCAIGLNTLAYKEPYGSRFAIGAVYTEGLFKAAKNRIPLIMNCSECNLCAKACPTGAIGKTFDRSRCIRNYMLRPETAPDSMLSQFGIRLLGCDICQRVCPYNNIESQKVPNSIKDLLEFSNLLKNIEENNLSEFSSFFGANYAAKNPLLSMLLINAANGKRTEFLTVAEKYTGSTSERVKRAAKYALERLRG